MSAVYCKLTSETLRDSSGQNLCYNLEINHYQKKNISDHPNLFQYFQKSKLTNPRRLILADTANNICVQ